MGRGLYPRGRNTLFSKIRRNAEKDLQKQIDQLMNVLKTNKSKENITQLYRLRAELNKIADYKTKGAIVGMRKEKETPNIS